MKTIQEVFDGYLDKNIGLARQGEEAERVLKIKARYAGELGHVYLDGNRLVAYLDCCFAKTRKGIGNALRKIEGLLKAKGHRFEVLQEGDYEATITDLDGPSQGPRETFSGLISVASPRICGALAGFKVERGSREKKTVLISQGALLMSARAKGAAFENWVGDRLEEWNGSVWVRTTLYWGSVKGKLSGDIVPVNTRFHFPFSVECKAQEGWGYDRLLEGKTSFKLRAFIKQCWDEAQAHDLLPLLIVKENRKPVLLFGLAGLFGKAGNPLRVDKGIYKSQPLVVSVLPFSYFLEFVHAEPFCQLWEGQIIGRRPEEATV